MPPRPSVSEMIAQKRREAKLQQQKQQQQASNTNQNGADHEATSNNNNNMNEQEKTPIDWERQELEEWFHKTTNNQQKEAVVVAFDEVLTKSHISPNGRYPERPNRLTRSIDLFRDYCDENRRKFMEVANNNKRRVLRRMPQHPSLSAFNDYFNNFINKTEDTEGRKEQNQQEENMLHEVKTVHDLANNPVLLSVHTSQHFRDFILHNKAFPNVSTDLFFDTSSDSTSNKENMTSSLVAARRAATLTIDATLGVLEQKWKHAFALVRPPGHHSGCDKCHGFCLINNAAAAVSAAVEKMKKEEQIADDGKTTKLMTKRRKRIIVFDIDVHHGDGTQQICDMLNKQLASQQQEEKDNANIEILFISIHRYDGGKFFPQTGHPDSFGEFGLNLNLGFDTFCAPSTLKQMRLEKLKKQEEEEEQQQRKLESEKGDENDESAKEEAPTPTTTNKENNIPLLQKFPFYKIICDETIRCIMDEFIEPLLLSSSSSEKDLLLVSCGFDAAEGDPLGGQGISKYGYRYIFEKLATIMKKKQKQTNDDHESTTKNTNGLVGVLEGGYDVEIVSSYFLEILKGLEEEEDDNNNDCNSSISLLRHPKHFENGRKNFIDDKSDHGQEEDSITATTSDMNLAKLNQEWTRTTIRNLCRKYVENNKNISNKNHQDFLEFCSKRV